MWITFTQGHKVTQGDGKGPVYEMGQSYEFKGVVSETYARKYIARGYAVEGRPKPKPAVAAEAAPAPAPSVGDKLRGVLPGLGGAPAAAAPAADLLSGATDK